MKTSEKIATAKVIIVATTLLLFFIIIGALLQKKHQEHESKVLQDNTEILQDSLQRLRP